MILPKDINWIKSPNNYLFNILVGKLFVCQMVASHKNKLNQLLSLTDSWSRCYLQVHVWVYIYLHLLRLLFELVMLDWKSALIIPPPPSPTFLAIITGIVLSLPHYLFLLFHYHFILWQWKRLMQDHLSWLYVSRYPTDDVLKTWNGTSAPSGVRPY